MKFINRFQRIVLLLFFLTIGSVYLFPGRIVEYNDGNRSFPYIASLEYSFRYIPCFYLKRAEFSLRQTVSNEFFFLSLFFIVPVFFIVFFTFGKGDFYFRTILVIIVLFLSAILIPNFLRARSYGPCSPCPYRPHLVRTAFALEKFAFENGHLYPSDLKSLVPRYIPEIQHFPQSETYLVYHVNSDRTKYVVRYKTEGGHPQTDELRFTSTRGFKYNFTDDRNGILISDAEKFNYSDRSLRSVHYKPNVKRHFGYKSFVLGKDSYIEYKVKIEKLQVYFVWIGFPEDGDTPVDRSPVKVFIDNVELGDVFYPAPRSEKFSSLLENHGWVHAGSMKLDSGEKVIKIQAIEDYYEPTVIDKIYFTPEVSAFPSLNGRRFIMPIEMDEFEQKYY